MPDDSMRACLFSGGKDSNLALHKMHDQGKDVELLITMSPEEQYSYMFHKPNVDFTSLQAESLGIKQEIFWIEGKKETELEDLEDALKEHKVDELVTGAVASVYQKTRIDMICEKLSIKHVAPIWGIDPDEELIELAKNYRVIITRVAAEGLTEDYLGAILDQDMIDRLKVLNEKYKVNVLFEGGEAESFVLDAPLFKKRIEIKEAHKIWYGDGGNYIIDDAVLVDKA